MSEQTVSRAAHIAWCKLRALEYCESGNLQEAFLSMMNDLGGHSETASHIGIRLGTMQYTSGMLSTVKDMRDFINGFN